MSNFCYLVRWLSLSKCKCKTSSDDRHLKISCSLQKCKVCGSSKSRCPVLLPDPMENVAGYYKVDAYGDINDFPAKEFTKESAKNSTNKNKDADKYLYVSSVFSTLVRLSRFLEPSMHLHCQLSLKPRSRK